MLLSPAIVTIREFLNFATEEHLFQPGDEVGSTCWVQLKQKLKLRDSIPEHAAT